MTELAKRMSVQKQQDAAPATEAPEQSGAEDFNAVGSAPGADRLEMIKGLIATAEPETDEVETEDVEGEDDETESTEDSSEESTTPDESPEAEAAEEQADEQDATQDESDEDLKGATPELKRRIAKRIGKEVAKRKALEDQLGAIQVKVKELEQRQPQQSQQPAPAPAGGPLDAVETPEQLRSVLDQAEATIDYAETALDRLETDADAVVRELRAAGVKLAEDAGEAEAKAFLRQVRRNAERTMRGADGAAQRIQTRQAFERQVEADFEWAKDKQRPESVQVRSILDQNAWLRNQPNGRFLAALFVEGLKSYESRKAKPKAAPAKVKKPAAQPGRPAAAPAKATGKDAEFQAARQAWLKDPSDKEARQRMIALGAAA
jgi:hypothetical protein